MDFVFTFGGGVPRFCANLAHGVLDFSLELEEAGGPATALLLSCGREDLRVVVARDHGGFVPVCFSGCCIVVAELFFAKPGGGDRLDGPDLGC